MIHWKNKNMNIHIVKKISAGAVIWLILILLFHSLGAFFYNDTIVYLMGGAKNLFIALAMALAAFLVSYAAPQKIFAKPDKESLLKVFLYQAFVIAALIILEYIVAFRLVLGFNIWDVKIMLTGALKQAVYIRIIVLILGGFIAGGGGLLLPGLAKKLGLKKSL